MHVVDDVHCLVVYPGNFVENLLVVFHDFIEVEDITLERLYVLHHQSAGVFAASAVDGKEECLCEICTCSEELDGLSDSLV